jgi:hypothetical protein
MFSTSKLVSIGFLLLVLFISLAISSVFPVITQIEYFQEGLLATTEQQNIQARLNKYVTETETICQASISGGNGQQGLNKITWSNQTEENSVLPIITNVNYLNTAKIDNLNQLTPPIQTEAAKTILQNNMASRYSITVTMLNDLKNMNIGDDSNFIAILNTNLATPIPNGNNSSYQQILNYVQKLNK